MQFGLRALLPHSNTPARNASRSDAGGPSLRVTGFEDDDEAAGEEQQSFMGSRMKPKSVMSVSTATEHETTPVSP